MNIGKIKSTEFIDHIEQLALNVDPQSTVKDEFGEYNEKSYLEGVVKRARELIYYNEWLVGLENALDDLCEIDYKLNDDILAPAEMAINLYPSDRQGLIEFLRK